MACGDNPVLSKQPLSPRGALVTRETREWKMPEYKKLLWTTVAGLAAALCFSGAAVAQKGGGGGRGGGGGGSRGGAGPSMGGRGMGPSGGGWGGNRGRDFDDRRGFGGGWYGWGLGWDDWGWGSYGSWYGDDYDSYRSFYPSPLPFNGGPGAPSAGMSLDDEASTAVRINVRVPVDAEVWVEGARTTQAGRMRRFVSPPLDPDRNYTYTVRARWHDNDDVEVDRTRKVQVSAGDAITVNFLSSQGGAKKPAQPLLPPPAPVR
jgi:uncharacterized protein (TIGR03000 family)